MRRLVKSVVEQIAAQDGLWDMIERSVGKFINYGRALRRASPPRQHESTYAELIQRYLGLDPIVQGGPFRGMRYPEMRALGSVLAPKLLGTYESELISTVQQLLSKNYNSIVDIGAAEGYYAVGLALRLPKASVYAFDTDPVAQKACIKLARANNAGMRVHVEGSCSPDRLLSLDLGNRALIWADCEGYERTLFTPEVIVALRRHDVVIELHDAIDLGISLHLTAAFEGSHRVELIDSIDDIRKTYTYDVPVLEGAPLEDRHALLAESRGGQMQWLVAWSRVAAG